MTCRGCGAQLPPKVGRWGPRVWCSESCRKRSYDLQCIDCGGRVCGTTPSQMANPDEPRCVNCAATHRSKRDRQEARTRIIAKIREWVATYGEPPATCDWSPYSARVRCNDETRARRAEDWPSVEWVYKVFGSWNDAICAAGFSPRRAGGSAENARRKRTRVPA